MYDVSQLNDLLVPELLDIAEELGIAQAKKLNKQDLINSILEKQSAMSPEKKSGEEKPKRKRINKKDADAPGYFRRWRSLTRQERHSRSDDLPP